jgi:thiol-disulfide isomerase/thioredoxin
VIAGKAGRLGLVLLLAASISIGVAYLGERLLAARTGEATGPVGGAAQLETFPDFSLPDPQGRETASSVWAGKVVVLNFWATWCPSCQRETALLADAQETLRGRGVQVVGIAIDRAPDVAAWLALHPVGYPILIGNPDSVELSRSLGNRTLGLPFTAIFDRKGVRVFGRTGELTGADLQAPLERLLPPEADTTHP